ncbi:choice-of-anchor X domain-containing protein [Silanimonas sp.]|jgi:hypothetical protein|uniref:choice-of-anchor X domain-containing protein n=1 Tax=Silanimonas sp. TaxID=1929290 RepID=UPI0022C1D9E4|nr:choice-of-anchor X domain-containing protein [Silanimonas sp.]MCZ8113530.1 hypothetical protein [Silanimonas sp.]
MNPASTLRRLPLAAALLVLPVLAQAQSLTATGAASPATNLNPGDWVLITVNTTKAANPTSTGVTVKADLSGFLRSTAQDLNDAGQYGDATAGDGVFTYRENIAGAATLGTKTIVATVRDAQGRSTTATFNATLGASSTGGGTTTQPVATVPLAIVGAASPTSVAPGGATLVTARVTAATNPTSTSIGVIANLSSLGGSKSQRLRDNGLNGDAVAGDGVYSFRQTVVSSIATGSKSVRFLVNDAQGRSASSSATVMVTAAETSVSPFGSASASPSSLLPGESSLLTVRVTAGTGPVSTGLSVTSDLSSLGLGAAQAFNDAGQNGDAVAGDGTYSFRATVPGAASAGTRTLSARVADAQGRSSTAAYSLTVNAAPAQTEPPVTSAGAPQACANFYTAGFALPQGQLVSTVPALGKPVKGTSYRDPVHGTCGIRVTDHANEAPSNFARHDYSRRQAFNADNSYLIVQAMNGFWHLYNANTMAFIRTLSGPAGDAEIQWHPTNPKALYYFDTNGGMVLRQLDVDTNTSAVAANFTGKLPWADAARAWTKSEGAPSADGRYWCLMAETSSFAIRGVFVYDLQTQTVVGSRSLTARPDHTGMSASGRWCVVSHLAGSGGTVAWDRSFTTSRQLHTTSEHSDLALNAAGQDVYVAVDYQANAGDFFMFNIDTNARTNLFPTYISGSATAYHVSGQAFAKPGWVLVSTYGTSGSNQWLHNKLFAVELKSGGRILNIGHHQSRLNGYFTEPQASVNRDFTRVIWASNFGTTSDTDIDAYMMYLPPSAIPAAQ